MKKLMRSRKREQGIREEKRGRDIWFRGLKKESRRARGWLAR